LFVGRAEDDVTMSEAIARFDARQRALDAADVCDSVVKAAVAAAADVTSYVEAAGRYARCAAEWAVNSYTSRVSAWLDDGAALCRHWTDKFVSKRSELAQVLVSYSPLVLSMAVPSFIAGVKLELEWCVSIYWSVGCL
jgi:hypothetical protein